MPKATITIGGPMSAESLIDLADAMANDGLPLRDHEDDDGPAQQIKLLPDGSPDPEFYRQALIDASGTDSPICLGAWDDDDDLTSVGKNTLRVADAIGLTVRIYQPAAFDKQYGEVATDAYMCVTGPDIATRGSAWVGSDGDPVLPITRQDVASPSAFALRFKDALKAWAIVDTKIPPLVIL